MSLRRLALTTVALAVLAGALAALTPSRAELATALTAPQATTDAAGADAVVLALCAALAWLVWAWGALGLALTAAGALPGLLGASARALQRALLPAGLRRAAAVTLGLGIGLGAPWTAAAAPSGVPASVPDWPVVTGTADPAPDWPAAPARGAHVVVRGDCLWDIAESRLTVASGRPPTAREVVTAVQAWWTANTAVIGPDPDLILPGQVLQPPSDR